MARVTALWVGLGLVATVGVVALDVGGPDTWRELGVPVITPRFADARIITAAAECDANGFDPLEANPCDQAGRVLNYPRVWVSISDLFGGSTDALAAVFSLAFLAGVTLAFRKLRFDLLAVVVFALALFSPPATLGFERANNDLLVVGLVAVAALLVARRATAPFVAGAVIVALTSVLKLFPLAVLPVLFVVAYYDDDRPRRRRNLLAATATALVVLVVLAIQASDIETIFDKAAEPSVYAYGFGSLWKFVSDQGLGGLFGDGALYFVAVTVAFVVVPVLAMRSFRRAPAHERRRVNASTALRGLASSEHGVLFLAGALLFAVTMLLDNYPYKLVLLALLLPQCVATLQGATTESRGQRTTALALIASIGALWVLVPLERGMSESGQVLLFPGQAFAVTLSFVLCVAVLALAVVHALVTWADAQPVAAER